MDKFEIKMFNLTMGAWIIFFCLFFTATIFLIGNIFSRRVINRLVKKEYLFRERDENDHRIIKISTTPKAKKALKVHTVKSLQNYHREMQIRMRKLFN